MYKISVILPTYNVESYLQRSFESLLSQTIGFENLQIIFVDDNSTDNSREITDRFAEEYENVLSIHLHDNSGFAGRPRNEGMKFAFAEYLLFLDPDDFLMENSCEVLYSKIIESGADIVVGGYKKGDWLAKWHSSLDADETLIENPKDTLSIYFNPPGLAAKLFKKELILDNNIKFPEEIPAQDLVFLTEAYLNANRILSLNDFIVHEYHVRKDEKNPSVSQKSNKEYVLKLLKAFNLTLDILEKFNVNNLLRKLYFTKNHFNFFRVQINNASLSDADLKEIFESELFMKFRNREFILEDEELNEFFNQMMNSPSSVEGKTLQMICRKAKQDYIISDDFTEEIAFNLKRDYDIPDEDVDDFEKELYSIIERNAKLYNDIEDYKKQSDQT